MIYVASPYTHEDHAIMEDRYERVAAFTAHLLRECKWCYSPIVHCHELAKKFDLPRDFAFWRQYNLAMLTRAKEFYVLEMPGWAESKGVSAEIEFARDILQLKSTLWIHHAVGYRGRPL